ncbi:MAG: hypothetical protein JRK53_06570 [Deltaproteobacteria bacterium]|nr:hypothetical protein [Deltaproteobacteria bacterium]MBW1816142.1 hypothetical protein [Deltaproteobacteria bacterium]
MKGILILTGVTLWVWLFPFPALSEDEYAFDLSEIEKEIEKKPYNLGGFFEFRPVLFGLDRNSAFYKIKFYDKDEGSTLEQYNSRLRLEGSYHKGIAGVFFRADSRLWYGYEGWDGDITLLEGYFALKPGPSFALEAGKKVVQWGKGYAFNTVNFVSRPKDPDDPTEPVEGYYLAVADSIKSFGGPLKTLALTPVILPVTKSINDKFGEPDHINFAAKLYGLLWDTDIDLLFFTGESRTTRYGLDFARNITSNFAVHGEFAWLPGFNKKSIDSEGNLYTEKSDVLKYLFGIRYLTTNDMTFIVEYYHNGAGLDENDADNFYRFVGKAYDTYISTGNSSGLDKAAQLSQGSIGTFKPMRDYLYFRASWNEPFDILYFTPAVFSIINLNDHSLSITPELLYNPITNLQLRLRGALLIGGNNSEFGEKQNGYKVELRVRYFFD